MKLALKNKIADRLKLLGGWVHKGRIEERSKEWGYLAETGDRRCRELVNEGILEKKEERGSVLYRYAKNEIKKEEQAENIRPETKTMATLFQVYS